MSFLGKIMDTMRLNDDEDDDYFLDDDYEDEKPARKNFFKKQAADDLDDYEEEKTRFLPRAQLPQLLVQLLHERRNLGTDDTEVVLLQLLTLGRSHSFCYCYTSWSYFR